MTQQQKQIIRAAQERGGRITKKEVVEMFGGNYYCNAAFHVGNILSRMVNAGLLVREKPGIFVIGSGKEKQVRSEVIENQTTLF